MMVKKNKAFLVGIFVLLMTSFTSTYIFAHSDGSQHKVKNTFSGLDSAAGRVITTFHQALKGGDKNLAKRLLADDVLIYEGGGVERSAEEYASHHLGADIKFLQKLTIKKLEHHVTVSGDIAYSTARSTMLGKIKNKKVNLMSLETILLKKINGDWLISHIHWSSK